MPPVGKGTEWIAVTQQCPALSPTAQENAEIRPMELVQGQTSTSQGKPKEMQLFLTHASKTAEHNHHKARKCLWIFATMETKFNQLLKMCEDPAVVIQTKARPDLCKFLLPGSLFTSRIPSHCLWGFKKFPSTEINVGILQVLLEAFKNILGFFLIFWKKFPLNFRYTGLHMVGAAGEQMVCPGFWNHPGMVGWEEDRLPFQSLFPDSSHNFKMRIYENTPALEEQNRAKGTKHFNEAKNILLSLLVYWCWACSKPKEKDSESIKIVGLWDLQCKHD